MVPGLKVAVTRVTKGTLAALQCGRLRHVSPGRPATGPNQAFGQGPGIKGTYPVSQGKLSSMGLKHSIFHLRAKKDNRLPFFHRNRAL